MLDVLTDSRDLSLSKLWEIVKDRKAWHAGVPEVAEDLDKTEWITVTNNKWYLLLINLYAEYIMRNTGLEEAWAGIKIPGRNINNLRYADDTTLMVETEEGLKSLLKKVKEESEKVGLKLNMQKTKIMASGPITSWEIGVKTVKTVSEFIFGGLQNHCGWWLQPWN